VTDIAIALATVDKAIRVIKTMRTEREDLVILVAHMAGDYFFSARDIADAVEKPWKFADVLAEAKAELAGAPA